MTAHQLEPWLVAKVAEVLKCSPEQVDSDAEFTALGLDSLALLTLMGELAQKLGSEVSYTLAWEHPTIAALARHLDSSSQDAELTISRAPRDKPLPLTSAQERIWGYSRKGPEGDLNIIVERFTLRGGVNVDALHRSLEEVMRRHDILRTTFADLDGRPVQIVHAPAGSPLTVIDLTQGGKEVEKSWEMITEEASRPMDLQSGPLVRAALLLITPLESRLVFALHHLLFDGGASEIFHEDLASFYNTSIAGEESAPRDETVLQVGDYAAWQRDWLRKDGEPYKARLNWWMHYWSGPMPRALELPCAWKMAPAALPSPQDCRIERINPSSFLDKAKALAREVGATPYAVYLAAFTVLLSHLTGQEEMVIGTYVSDRTRPTARRLMGVFVSMLPVRLDLSGQPTFHELIMRTRRTIEQASINQDLPFEDLCSALREAGRETPPIQVIFNYYDQGGLIKFSGLEVSLWDPLLSSMPWGFSAMVGQSGNDLKSAAGFDGNLYDPAEVAAMLKQYGALLEAATSNPHQPIASLLSRESAEAAPASLPRPDLKSAPDVLGSTAR